MPIQFLFTLCNFIHHTSKISSHWSSVLHLFQSTFSMFYTNFWLHCLAFYTSIRAKEEDPKTKRFYLRNSALYPLTILKVTTPSPILLSLIDTLFSSLFFKNQWVGKIRAFNLSCQKLISITIVSKSWSLSQG